jgi:2-C-methyl-D-erythritol 2,4-cyclodiphosphate synthase
VARSATPVRVGQGWDIHRLVRGRPLRLGGVEVPFDRGLLGHSDGDVVLHAIADALLGAAAAGDIGQHFPDTDARFRNIDSALLLERVVELVATGGFGIGNVDVTILAEQPKLAPHVGALQRRVAELLRIDADRVGIKAKTMEGLGAIGGGEAIAALAVITIAPVGRRRPKRVTTRRHSRVRRVR